MKEKKMFQFFINMVGYALNAEEFIHLLPQCVSIV